MYQDVSDYVANCPCCQIAKGHYVSPNKPLELLHIDFLKVDLSQDGKENVLVLTNAFSKFRQAFVTPNQKALTVTKVLVDKCFYVYSIPT